MIHPNDYLKSVTIKRHDNGKIHSHNSPAYTLNGVSLWMENGALHNIKGPALEHKDFMIWSIGGITIEDHSVDNLEKALSQWSERKKLPLTQHDRIDIIITMMNEKEKRSALQNEEGRPHFGEKS